MSEIAKFVSITPDAEKTIAYCARVSNPKNQDSDNIAGLLKYCIKHKHWSIFEMANLVIEVNTSRGISAQILRHRSFNFQEASTRYMNVNELCEHIPIPDLRRQDTKNRQNSIDDIDGYLKLTLQGKIAEHFDNARKLYDELISHGVAKECSRNILPLATPTRIYINGNIRSWITYIALREKSGTQQEHKEVALACKKIFAEHLPVVTEALGGADVPWVV